MLKKNKSKKQNRKKNKSKKKKKKNVATMKNLRVLEFLLIFVYCLVHNEQNNTKYIRLSFTFVKYFLHWLVILKKLFIKKIIIYIGQLFFIVIIIEKNIIIYNLPW